MPLLLAIGDVNKIGVGEPRRLPQDGRRNRNVVIARKPPYDLDRRIIHRRQPLTEFGESLALNSLDQVAQDIVKNLNLLIAEPVGIGDEKIGDAAQGIYAFVLRAALDGIFQFSNQRGGLSHLAQQSGLRNARSKPVRTPEFMNVMSNVVNNT